MRSAVSFVSCRTWFRRVVALTATLWCAVASSGPVPQLINQNEADLAPYRNAKTYVNRDASELIATIPDLKGLEPPASAQEGEDALRVILNKVGENVRQFIERVPDTISLEEITMERLRPDGRIDASQRQTFHYLIVPRNEPARTTLEEYRTDAKGEEVEPSGLAEGLAVTSGFASGAIHFHPLVRSDSFFRYLGKQTLDGKEMDVVAFAQRPGWGQVIGVANVAGRSALILVQGLAWIDPTCYEIMRMRMDLLAPRPDIGLKSQTTQITFGKVQFPEMPDVTLCLPHEVTVTMEWEGRVKVTRSVVSSGSTREVVATSSVWEGKTYRNIHRYSDYRLFGSTTKLKF